MYAPFYFQIWFTEHTFQICQSIFFHYLFYFFCSFVFYHLNVKDWTESLKEKIKGNKHPQLKKSNSLTLCVRLVGSNTSGKWSRSSISKEQVWRNLHAQRSESPRPGRFSQFYSWEHLYVLHPPNDYCSSLQIVRGESLVVIFNC